MQSFALQYIIIGKWENTRGKMKKIKNFPAYGMIEKKSLLIPALGVVRGIRDARRKIQKIQKNAVKSGHPACFSGLSAL